MLTVFKYPYIRLMITKPLNGFYKHFLFNRNNTYFLTILYMQLSIKIKIKNLIGILNWMYKIAWKYVLLQLNFYIKVIKIHAFITSDYFLKEPKNVNSEITLWLSSKSFTPIKWNLEYVRWPYQLRRNKTSPKGVSWVWY